MRRKPVRIAVAGCGGIARQYHLRALAGRRDARVVAVADPDSSARAAAARRAGDATAYADPLDAIARTDVDAVVVCAPNAVHAELAIAALEAGRHLYLEKPLATTPDDARRVVAAGAQAGIVGAVGLAFRFDPVYRRVRALIAEGAVGRVRGVSTTYFEPLGPAHVRPSWKAERAQGGGVLGDLATHHIDLVTWLTGLEIDSVAHADIESLDGEDDLARFDASLSGDASFEGAFGYGERRCEWVFAGDEGWLAVDRCARRVTLARDGVVRRWPRGDAVLRRVRTLPVIRRERIFARALDAWIGAIGGGARGALATLDDGLRAVHAVEAINRAAAVPVEA